MCSSRFPEFSGELAKPAVNSTFSDETHRNADGKHTDDVSDNTGHDLDPTELKVALAAKITRTLSEWA